MPIPRIIHQIWYQGEDVPEKYKEWQKSWKKNNPTWEYHIWTEPKMDKIMQMDKYKWFYPTWKAYPKMIQRIDTFKWTVLHLYGGYYVDLDMECLRPLKGLLTDDCEFAIGQFKPFYRIWGRFVGVNLIVNNAFIASIPNHVFIMEFLKESEKVFIKNKKKQSAIISKTTGPLIVSNVVSKYLKKYKIFLADDKLVEIYPPEVKKYGQNGYIIHHSECSWADKKSLLHMFDPVITNPGTSIVIIVVIIILALFLLAIAIFAIIKIQRIRQECRLYL